MAMQSSTRMWLVLSLALNLFMAGAIASYLVVGRDHGHRGPPGRAHSLHPRALRKVLPEQDQAVLDEVLNTHRGKLRERVKLMREARRNVATAMRAEPFDRRSLDAALADLRAREADMAVAGQGMAAELASRVSPEGRVKLAEQMQPRKWRRRGPPDHAPEPPPERPPGPD